MSPHHLSDRPLTPRSDPLGAPADYSWERESHERHDSDTVGAYRAPPASAVRSPIWRAQRVPTTTHTAPVWFIVCMPYIQLVTSAAVFLSLSLGEMRLVLTTAVFYLLTFLCAMRDSTVLGRAGYDRPPQSAWALLGPLPYLIARTVVVKRELGVMSSTLWIWLLNLIVCAGATAALALTIARPYLQYLGLVGE